MFFISSLNLIYLLFLCSINILSLFSSALEEWVLHDSELLNLMKMYHNLHGYNLYCCNYYLYHSIRVIKHWASILVKWISHQRYFILMACEDCYCCLHHLLISVRLDKSEKDDAVFIRSKWSWISFFLTLLMFYLSKIIKEHLTLNDS